MTATPTPAPLLEDAKVLVEKLEHAIAWQEFNQGNIVKPARDRLLAHIDAQAVRLEAAERDAERWRYAIADGGNQSMNFIDIYDDWNGEDSFVDAFDAAIASEAKP